MHPHGIFLKRQLTRVQLGILLEVEIPSSTKKRKGWSLLVASVGNIKAYHYSVKEGTIAEVTTRTALNDIGMSSSDPGGRLGPCISNGGPDLRNFHLYAHYVVLLLNTQSICRYYCQCSDEDLILVMTNGVADNFDPENLGVSPQQVIANKYKKVCISFNTFY